MGSGKIGLTARIVAVGLSIALARFALAQHPLPFIFSEQRAIEVRDPSDLPAVPLPAIPAPPTVADPLSELPPRALSLDEAIRIALARSEVVRVLAGVAAVSSGRTIYDAAITHNGTDAQHSRFDPQLQVRNSFTRDETPEAAFDPLDPTRASIGGLRADRYGLDLELSKTIITGGTVSLGLNTDAARLQPGTFPLNPQARSSLDLSLTQPLLQGGGLRANLAPIVLARIDTERSFFQFKDSVQDLVRGVIEAYWAVVFARTEVRVRQWQLEQLQEAYHRARAMFKVGSASLGDVEQPHVAYASARASLIAARANLLQREAALRNILGLPPSDAEELVPITPPNADKVDPPWNALLELAAERRPDIIELKLILEADEQSLLQARNQALPRADAVALYRWNGLEGEMPTGEDIASRPGQFTDWTLGVNFSVPLGLRRERANLRQKELLLARDRAHLEQGLHAVSHILATKLRNLALYYAQYEAYQEMRAAAWVNYKQQWSEWKNGRVIFLNVLLATNDVGNAASAVAQSLLQYNTELADLERQTGTILETHGIRFYEERFGSLGPLGRLHAPACYPSALPPTWNADRYPHGEDPAEKTFLPEMPLAQPSSAPPPRAEEIPAPGGRP